MDRTAHQKGHLNLAQTVWEVDLSKNQTPPFGAFAKGEDVGVLSDELHSLILDTLLALEPGCIPFLLANTMHEYLAPPVEKPEIKDVPKSPS